MAARVTNEELASSMDELWTMMSDLQAQVAAIGKQLEARDRMNLLLVAHVRRLTKEKQTLMVHLGYKYLEQHPAMVRAD